MSEGRSEIPVRLSFLNHVLSELDKEVVNDHCGLR
jgi:hypothetical protein